MLIDPVQKLRQLGYLRHNSLIDVVTETRVATHTENQNLVDTTSLISSLHGWWKRGLDINGEAAGDHAGISVSISSDGNTVAIGADESIGSRGSVRVYAWTGYAWTQKGMDIVGEAAGDYFGISVSVTVT